MRAESLHAARALLSSLVFASAAASAQDAVRGAALYRVLPGEPAVGSCISCHGEPVNNRNGVLRGAAGPELISKTIAAVSRMGFLRQYLTDADLADVAAYLATIVPAGPVDTLPDLWPTADDFGSQLVGTQSSAREILIRNLQPRTDVAVGAVLSADPLAFPVQHDCPVSLPPLGQCTATAWFRPQTEGSAVAAFKVVDASGRTLREGTVSGVGVAAAPPVLAWLANAQTLIDFGQVPLGRTAQRELTLQNTSSAGAAIQTLRVTGPNAARFTMEGSYLTAGRLEGMAACTMTLTFTPTGAGRAEGWIEVTSNASNAPLVRVAAAGVAVPAAPPAASAPPAEAGNGTGGGASSAGWVAMLCVAVLALRGRRQPPV